MECLALTVACDPFYNTLQASIDDSGNVVWSRQASAEQLKTTVILRSPTSTCQFTLADAGLRIRFDDDDIKEEEEAEETSAPPPPDKELYENEVWALEHAQKEWTALVQTINPVGLIKNLICTSVFDKLHKLL